MGYPTQQDPFGTIFTLLASPIGWLIVLLFVILVFLIIREILCWYWKINEGLDSLNDIKREIATTNALLRKIELSTAQNPPAQREDTNVQPPNNTPQ